jgi:RecB family endonuclease NucS
MDEREKPPQVATVQEMANLASQDKATPITVGVNWIDRFIKRHNELQSRFSRKYDYQQVLCKDPKIIQEWFKLVRSTTEKNGILPEDTYNFDEIGFMMGIIATLKAVTGSEKNLRPKLIQPGNRE